VQTERKQENKVDDAGRDQESYGRQTVIEKTGQSAASPRYYICYDVCMAIDKSLSLIRIVKAFKKAGFPTKKDVREIVGNEIEARNLATEDGVKETIQNELAKYQAGHIGPQFKDMGQRINKLDKKIDRRSDRLEAGQKKNEANIIENRRRIDDVKAEVIDGPSRKEFEDLKTKVSAHHPVN
jgi:hypothetical protein